MKSNTLWRKSLVLSLVIVSLMLVSIIGLVGCGEQEDEPVDPDAPDFIVEDGTYKISGLKAAIGSFHPENFGDDVIVEKKDGIYYVTIEIVDNEKVTVVYYKDRKDSVSTDSVVVTEGINSKHMFAFNDKNIRKENVFCLVIPNMPPWVPVTPSIPLKIDPSKLVKISDEVKDMERPAPFLD